MDDKIAHWRSSDNTPHLVRQHLRDVGALSAFFASKLHAPLIGELLGLLHDLGKYSKAFQDYIRSALGMVNCDEDDYVDANAQRGKIDHSSAGAQFIWHVLSEKGALEFRLAQILSLCIASHHSGLIDCLNVEGDDNFTRRMNKEAQKTHLDEVGKVADPEILKRANEILNSPELISELKCIVSRIFAKNPEQYRARRRNGQLQIGFAVRFLFSCLIDADRIDTADFEHKRVQQYRLNGNYAAWHVLIERLEGKLAAMLPTRSIDFLRRDISQHCLDAAARDGGIDGIGHPIGLIHHVARATPAGHLVVVPRVVEQPMQRRQLCEDVIDAGPLQVHRDRLDDVAGPRRDRTSAVSIGRGGIDDLWRGCHRLVALTGHRARGHVDACARCAVIQCQRVQSPPIAARNCARRAVFSMSRFSARAAATSVVVTLNGALIATLPDGVDRVPRAAGCAR